MHVLQNNYEITMKLYLEKRIRERMDEFRSHRQEKAEEGKDKPGTAGEVPKDTSMDSSAPKTACTRSNMVIEIISTNASWTRRRKNRMTIRNYTRKCARKNWRKK